MLSKKPLISISTQKCNLLLFISLLFHAIACSVFLLGLKPYEYLTQVATSYLKMYNPLKILNE